MYDCQINEYCKFTNSLCCYSAFQNLMPLFIVKFNIIIPLNRFHFLMYLKNCSPMKKTSHSIDGTAFFKCFTNVWLVPHVTGKKVDEDDDGEDSKLLEEMTEEERIAQLGKPRLGESRKVAVHIQESMEFKVSCKISLWPPHLPCFGAKL